MPFSYVLPVLDSILVEDVQSYKTMSMQRRRRQIINNQRVPRNIPQIMPKSLTVALNYSEPLNFTTTSGLAYDYQFNLNSIFDPNRSGGGHQALGHDQWATLYGRYRVDRTRVTVTWLNAPAAGAMCSVLFSNSVNSITNAAEAIENPMGQTKGMSPNGLCTTITRTQDLNQVTGVSKSVYKADDRFESLFGSNPSETLIAHVVTFTTTSATFDINVVLTYDVTLFDHLQLTVS